MRNRLFPMILLLAMVMVSSCSDPVGTITLESPEIPDGARELVIRATDSKGASISGFNLQITGPTTANATVSGAEYVFTNLASGLYTIVITKSGYVGDSFQLPVVLPTNPKVDFKASAVVKATQLTPPVPISNATGGTVQSPGPSNTGPRSQPTQVSIPAGAIPGAGTTQVSVTQTAPVPITQTSQPLKAAPGNSVENTISPIPLDRFIFSFTNNGSEVTAFTQPVEIGIPMGVPQTIRNEQFSFVLMSGSGSGATPTTESRPIVINASTGNATTTILKPGTYRVYATLGLTATTAQSDPYVIGIANCGVGRLFTFSSPAAPTLGSVMAFLGVVPAATTASGTVDAKPVVNKQAWLRGVSRFTDYRVNRPGGTQLETYRFPLAEVTTTLEFNDCHDGGGN